ncbi:hypothetical protein Tco_1298385 [Tanacetum coccineum]
MDLMNRVCKPYLDKFVIVFINYILIYLRRKEEHEEHLKLILELLKKEELARWRVNAKGQSNSLCIPSTKGSGPKLYDSQFGVRRYGVCSKDLETLLVWHEVYHVHRSQKPATHPSSEGNEYETTSMVGTT